MADGSIRIDTTIDIKKAQADLKQLERLLKETEKEQDKLLEGKENEAYTQATNFEKERYEYALKTAKTEEQRKRIQQDHYAIQEQIDNKYSSLIQKSEDYQDRIANTKGQIQSVKERIESLQQSQQAATNATKEQAAAEQTVAQGTQQSNTHASRLAGFFKSARAAAAGVGKAVGVTALVGARKLGQVLKNKVVNAFKNAKSHLLHMTKSADSMRKKFLRIGLALVGMRGLMAGLRQIVSSAMEQNEKMKTQITTIKGVVAQMLTPAIQIVANALGQVVTWIDTLYSRLTGVSLIAKYNTTQAEKLAKETEKAADNAKEYRKQLAGFDIANKLENNQDTNKTDTPETAMQFEKQKLSSWADNLIDEIKNAWIDKDFTEVGELLAGKIADGLKSINWTDIKQKAFGTGKSFATLLNGLFKYTDKDGESLTETIGETLGEAINTAVELGLGFVTKFKWKKAGKELAKGFNKWVKTVKWKKIGKLIGDSIKGILEGLDEFIKKIDGEKVGAALGKIIKEIPWGDIIIDLFYIVADALKLGFDVVAGLFDELGNDPEGVKKKTAKFVKDFKKWVVDSLGPMIVSLVTAITSVLKNSGTIGQAIIDGFWSGILGEKHADDASRIAKVHEWILGLLNPITRGLTWTDIIATLLSKIQSGDGNIDPEHGGHGQQFNVSIIGSFIEDAKNKASILKDKITGIIGDGKAKVKKIIGRFVESAKNKASTLKKKISGIIGDGKAKVKQVIAQFKEDAKENYAKLKNKIDNIRKKTVEITAQIKDKITSVLQTIINKLIDGINWLINQVNKFIPGTKNDVTPLEPVKLAAGGIVNNPVKGVSAIVGEAGPEAVLPLTDSVLSKLAGMINSYGNGQQIVIPVYLDGKQIANYTVDTINKRSFQMNRAVIK